MSAIKKFLIEGIDRLGKDSLIQGIQDRTGYHQVLHFSKPVVLACYPPGRLSPERQFQEASFRNLFDILGAANARIICNRTHLGECVYGRYRGYSGDYVFDIEAEYRLNDVPDVRLILLTEDFRISRHFVDDGHSLAASAKRPEEQTLFVTAFERSMIADKRIVSVTAPNGEFRARSEILDDVLR